MQECKEHYETVCQTTYTQKNVLEDKVSCQMKQEVEFPIPHEIFFLGE